MSNKNLLKDMLDFIGTPVVWILIGLVIFVVGAFGFAIVQHLLF